MTLLGALPLGTTVSDIIAATIAKVNPTVDAMAGQLLTPAFRHLGFTLGSVDVAALRDSFDPAKCGLPAPVR